MGKSKQTASEIISKQNKSTDKWTKWPHPPLNFVCGGFNKYVSILFHPNFIIRDSKH